MEKILGYVESGKKAIVCNEKSIHQNKYHPIALFLKLIGTYELRNWDPTFYEIGTK